MMPFLFDPTIILLIPALLFASWAQWKVSSTYKEYSQVRVRSGMTGAKVAAAILRDADIPLTDDPNNTEGLACGLEMTQGQLTDHYDPRSRTLRLSEGVYQGRNVAALGVAAHEVGHAIQHKDGYGPLVLRNVAYPVSKFGSTLAFPLFLAGLFIPAFSGLMHIGIMLFTLAVFFTVLTLPVEFNASSRALAALSEGGYVNEEELAGVKKVLNAAAMTYVASAAMAALQLIRMILIAQARN